MVDPETSRFWVSWQIHDAEKGEGGVLEDAEIVGADAAIAWGRERADEVFIRLGDTGTLTSRPGPLQATIPFRAGHRAARLRTVGSTRLDRPFLTVSPTARRSCALRCLTAASGAFPNCECPGVPSGAVRVAPVLSARDPIPD